MGGTHAGSRACQAYHGSDNSSFKATATELITLPSLSFIMFKLSPAILEALFPIFSPGSCGDEYNLGVHKRVWLLMCFSQEAATICEAGDVCPTQIPLTVSILSPVKWEIHFFRWCCGDKGLILKCHLREGRWSCCCLGKNTYQVVGCGKHRGEAMINTQGSLRKCFTLGFSCQSRWTSFI